MKNLNTYPYILTNLQLCVLQNFPFIEDTFDSLTLYGIICKTNEELEKVISNVNTIESNISILNDNINTINTKLDTKANITYVNENLELKFDKNSVKTTNVTSDTDTYSCTYINEKIGNIENILNTINSGSGV